MAEGSEGEFKLSKHNAHWEQVRLGGSTSCAKGRSSGRMQNYVLLKYVLASHLSQHLLEAHLSNERSINYQ